MHKQTITQSVNDIAEAYKKLLIGEPLKGILPKYDFLKNIRCLMDQLQTGKAYMEKTIGKCVIKMDSVEKEPFLNYLAQIINNYENLLVCKPATREWSDLENRFSFLSFDELKTIIVFDSLSQSTRTIHKKKRMSFHRAIVYAMGYQFLQSNVFPMIMAELGIKTCVYCNAQFAISVDSKTALFQLDHCLPTAIFPCFSTSFFNLQPSCGSCNQRKSYTDMRTGVHKEISLSIWKNYENPEPNDFFHFHLNDHKLAQYLLSASAHDCSLLELKLQNLPNASEYERELLELVEKKFHITDQYNKHLDIVEETIWRYQIYSNGYINSLKDLLGDFFPDVKNQIYRMIAGIYEGPDNVYKRPLSILMRDLFNQLEFLLPKKKP